LGVGEPLELLGGTSCFSVCLFIGVYCYGQSCVYILVSASVFLGFLRCGQRTARCFRFGGFLHWATTACCFSFVGFLSTLATSKVAGYIIVWTLHRDGVPRPVHARRSAFCRHSPECFLSPLGVAHSVRLIINVTMSIVSIIRERWVDTDQEHQESF
jgi:hypothetical protein